MSLDRGCLTRKGETLVVVDKVTRKQEYECFARIEFEKRKKALEE
jgi:hypothetical protein